MSSSQDSSASAPAKFKPSSRASKKRPAPEAAEPAPPPVPAPEPASAPDVPPTEATPPTEVPAPIAGEPADPPEKGKKSKKSSFMSASIPDMSVGDVRKCLNEIRRLGPGATSGHVLATNGWTAGDFALKYLLGNNPSGKNAKEDS
eukprot:jgi/Mesvir1/10389/Mv10587-RA.1